MEGFNSVEVAFHDTSRSRKRIPVLNDFYRFHLAAMSEQVALGLAVRGMDCMPYVHCMDICNLLMGC